MVDHVRRAIEGLEPGGRVVDLFSGVGSVAESFRDLYPIATNDVLGFTAAISRARFTVGCCATKGEESASRLHPAYLAQLKYLSDRFAPQIEVEQAALRNGQAELASYMSSAHHVGNDRSSAHAAQMASEDETHRKYCLVSLYFSAGYFSLSQAIEIDAIRFAIDTVTLPEEVDLMVAAWLIGSAAILNAPGHTAQYLKAHSKSGYEHVVKTWRRSVWEQFEIVLGRLQPVGSEDWRAQNRVFVSDAIDLIGSDQLGNVGAYYADPPYTKDQYSRYYHVYETMYRYDFPDSMGAGRYRSERPTSGFSRKTMVVASFHDLCRNVSRSQVPLVLSYPHHGLLNDAGWNLADIVSEYFADVRVLKIDARHSTLGASKGSSQKLATEHLYVCRP